MDQKSIVLYLGLKGMTAVEIHADLIAMRKTEAVCYGSVGRYLRSRSFTASIDPGQCEQPDPVLTKSDKELLAALEEHPFASIRQLAQVTHLTPSTVYCHLTGQLGYLVRQRRSVSHILSAADKYVRAQFSFRLLELLESQIRRSWHNIVILDESWFYLNADCARSLASSRSSAP
jgi:hypothetical protein